MSRPVKIEAATTASEVIANALKYWGRDGRRWVSGTLYDGAGGVCFYGGLSAGAYGTTVQEGETEFNQMSMPYEVSRVFSRSASTKAYKKAEKYILDVLEEHGYEADIVQFNDEEGEFPVRITELEDEISEVKDAIEDLRRDVKYALDKETREGSRVYLNKNKKELRELKAKLKEAKKSGNKLPPSGTFKGVKAVACLALKKALADEQAKDIAKKRKRKAA